MLGKSQCLSLESTSKCADHNGYFDLHSINSVDDCGGVDSLIVVIILIIDTGLSSYFLYVSFSVL